MNNFPVCDFRGSLCLVIHINIEIKFSFKYSVFRKVASLLKKKFFAMSGEITERDETEYDAKFNWKQV